MAFDEAVRLQLRAARARVSAIPDDEIQNLRDGVLTALELISQIITHLKPRAKPRAFLGFFSSKDDTIMSTGVMSVDSPGLVATLLLVDDKGNPTRPTQTPVWSSSDETVATVAAGEDGMTATVTPVGKAGECDINVVCGGDNEDGSDTVHLTGHVTATPGEAVGGDISFAAAAPPGNGPAAEQFA